MEWGGVMKCFKLLKGYFIKKLPFLTHSSCKTTFL